MTTGKTIALTRQTFVGKVMSLLFFLSFFFFWGNICLFFFLFLILKSLILTCVPKHEPPSHLPPYTISLGHPSAPAPSILYPALNLDWRFISYMIVYMFQCHSPKSSHPLPLPLSPKVHYTHLCLFCCLACRVIIAIFLGLFIIARTWKQPRCPSADEWVRKLWFTQPLKIHLNQF